MNAAPASADNRLWCAVNAADVAGVAEALRNGADPLASSPSHKRPTSLLIAALQWPPSVRGEIMGMLFAAMGDVETQVLAVPVGLMLGCVGAAGCADVVDLVAQHEHILAAATSNLYQSHPQQRPMGLACGQGHTEVVAALLRARLYTPNDLHDGMVLAAEHADSDIVRMLLDAGADPKHRQSLALQWASHNGDETCFALLYDTHDEQSVWDAIHIMEMDVEPWLYSPTNSHLLHQRLHMDRERTVLQQAVAEEQDQRFQGRTAKL